MNQSSGMATDSSLPPPPKGFRWTVLVIISLAMFGNYYIYDCISPLADVLTSQLGFTDANIGLLQGIYSTPNIIMVLIGGRIIDHIGTRKSAIIFGALCFLGAGITAATSELYVMAAGRFVFGIGAESLIVAVTVTIAKWFRGKELGFAMGLNLTIARFGSIAALNSPTWAKEFYRDWQLPLLIAVGAGVICIVAALTNAWLERSAAKSYSLGEAGETDKVDFKSLFKFSKSYWFVVALCVVFYSAIFPFQTFAIKFFQYAHGETRETAGFLSSLILVFSMSVGPVFGYLSDRIGRRGLMMMLGSACLLPVYLIMGYTQIPLWMPIAIMGVSFALVPAVMWPSVAYLVKESKLGTAYGLMTAIQNVGLSAFNFIIGGVNTAFAASEVNVVGYRPGMLIFTSLGFFGLLFAFLLRRNEMGPKGHGLETIKIKS